MEERQEIITLIDEEGEKFDFVVLDYFQVDSLDYAILLPYGPNGSSELEEEEWAEGEADPAEEEGDAVIFRVIKGNNGETVLQMIEDEEEWDRVVEIAYERLFSEEDEGEGDF